MRTSYIALPILAIGGLTLSAVADPDQWVDLEDETASRLVNADGTGYPPGVSPVDHFTDTQEKDYTWGDVDMDGDIDLVVVRKQPFTSQGKDINCLFMNEGIAEGHSVDGVLVDKTLEYFVDSDINGDLGFLTPTNDRDAILHDLNGDGWLDLVTAVTLTDNQAKHLSHPRIYINLGEDGGGNWLGFRYEDARIPSLHPTAGPRFCSVNVGDLTGDDAPDLYFGDYDSGGFQIFDFNNRVLVNDGNGFFTDETFTVLPTSQMRDSAFGASAHIGDFNGDGRNDIAKQTSLNAPLHVAVNYNDPNNEGVMLSYDIVNTQAPYFVAAADLNNDGKLDMAMADDGTDHYHLNQGNAGNGEAIFNNNNFLLEGGGQEVEFGGNLWIDDLDHDGWNDVIITDVDVDLPSCSRRTKIYRNLGGPMPAPGEIGPDVVLQEIGQIIPFSELNGVHDVAVFDLNGDELLDIIMGRCGSMEIYIQQQTAGLSFLYPEGRPSFLVPDEAMMFPVQIAGVGGGTPEAGTQKVFVSVDGGATFTETALTPTGNPDEYEAALPASACSDRVRYYVQSDLDGGGEFRDPPSAPNSSYSAVAALGSEVTVENDMEADVTGWTVENDPSLTGGGWEVAVPNVTLAGTTFVAPNEDATQDGTKAWVTQNAPFAGATAGLSDIDRGPTRLTSPTIDLAGTDAFITFERWRFSADAINGEAADPLVTEVSNDNGATWVLVDELFDNTTGGDNSVQTEWTPFTFLVGDFVEPTGQVRVRFSIEDFNLKNLSEAGIDDFQVDAFICNSAPPPCPGDLVGDTGRVDADDILAVINDWGCVGDCTGDANGNGVVDSDDILFVVNNWGDCPAP